MNLDYLRYFKELAETEHYLAAAEKLNISQPNLSYAISALEKELGYDLFDKAGRNIRLNEYGRIYYEYVSEALAKMDEAETRLALYRHNKECSVNIGMTHTVASSGLLPMLLLKYQQEHKDKPAHFSTEQYLTTEDIVRALRAGHLDLGICFKTNNASDLRQQLLLPRPVCAVIPEGHPLAAKEKIVMADIAAEPMILGHASTRVSRAFTGWLREKNLPLPEITYLNKPQECMANAVFQQKITVLAYAQYFRLLPVAVREIEDFPLDMNYYLTERSGNAANNFIHSVFKFLAENAVAEIR